MRLQEALRAERALLDAHRKMADAGFETLTMDAELSRVRQKIERIRRGERNFTASNHVEPRADDNPAPRDRTAAPPLTPVLPEERAEQLAYERAMIPLTVAVRHVMRELRKQYPRAIVAKAIRGALLNISTNHQQLLYEAEHPPVPAAGNEGANGRSVARAGR